MASPVGLLKRSRIGMLGVQSMVKRTWELTDVLRKAQPLIRVDHTFCMIKQLPILKLMDDREVVEQYFEVLLDQITHAEMPEH